MTIRQAQPADVPEVLSMIKELAAYEKLADQVVCSEEQLGLALFGPDPVIRVTLALNEGNQIAGYALWYRTFSTFLGRTGIWLEDLFVRPADRRHGYGEALLAHLRSLTGGRVEWEVLNWNQPSIAFYEQLGARPESGWTKYRWI